MMERILMLACAFALDCAFGDPHGFPHLIRCIGSLITGAEHVLRRLAPPSPTGERVAGIVLVVIVLGLSSTTVALALALAYRLSPAAGFVVGTFVCYQMVAAKQLRIEAERVEHALVADGIEAGRKAVSWIVGRDTAALDEAGVIRAAVETVAENASDGVVAPWLFLALGGPVGGVLYKAANTMDSMVGYTNERYLYFGRAAARLDDLLNWVPARLTALLMCAVAPLVGLDGRRAFEVMRRDHARHASPNAAWPEAACAGALGVELAGPASYFGHIHDKPTIGDATRPIETADIRRATRLLRATAFVAFVLACASVALVCRLAGRW